jgi:hypothetical protein
MDSDFKGNIREIPIINPNEESFHQKILSLLEK